jgi:hypothetical protein
LIVLIGANNALGTVIDLKVKWSREGFDGIGAKGAFKIWRPAHFAIEFDRLAEAVQAVGARHVIWATVPHVTIAPVAHVDRWQGPARLAVFPVLHQAMDRRCHFRSISRPVHHVQRSPRRRLGDRPVQRCHRRRRSI